MFVTNQLQLLYYESYEIGIKPNDSDAYYFRPHNRDPKPLTLHPETTFITGPLVQQVKQTFSDFAQQTIRLYKSSSSTDQHSQNDFVEFEFTIGPLPLNTELIVKFETDIANKKNMFTDNNAFQLWERTRVDTPDQGDMYPIANNYYPVQYSSAIRDQTRVLTFVTNSSRGVATLKEGSIEFMLHRRLNCTNMCNAGIPLDDDDSTTTITLRLLLDSVSVSRKAITEARPYQALSLNFPADLFFFTKVDSELVRNFDRMFYHTLAPLSKPLPYYAHLQTLAVQLVHSSKPWQLLRLSNLYQQGLEQSQVPVLDLELTDWFIRRSITEHVETSLMGASLLNSTTSRVVLKDPLQIRTYLLR
jgi:hypothetical protein